MGQLPAPDPSLIPGVHFVYRDASGTDHRITGNAEVGSPLDSWLRYAVYVRYPGDTGRMHGRFYQLQFDWQFEVTATDDPLGGDASLYWWNALRRFAVEQTLNDLDLGNSNQEPYTVDLAMCEVLRRHGFRTCIYLSDDSGGTPRCSADASGDDVTRRADCAKCPVPDEWEMCGQVSDVKTRGVRADGGWVCRRLLGGMCQLGRKPGQRGVPVGCRGGTESQPECFVPRTVEGSKSRESHDETDLEDLVSAVNVEWDKQRGFGLFGLVSYQPLKHLRGECANAAEFQSRIGGVSELLQKLNEKALRDMAPSVTFSVQRGHTLTVLEAVLRELEYPHGESVVADLRLVQRLRNLPPTHPPDQGGARAIEALRELGIHWPVGRDDWPQAWGRARTRLARGLQTLLDDLRSAS